MFIFFSLLFVKLITCTPPVQWFTQTLDHFDALNNATFQQKYFVNATFFKAGGPVFVQVGGEGPLDGTEVTSLQMSIYAKYFNALQVTLEHRGYGGSKFLPTLKTENLKFLSSQQALADLANFVTAVKQAHPTARQVGAFGGSYPGALAAWARTKYPWIFDFAIASSAPVRAELDMYQYFEQVGRSLTEVVGPQCDALIRSGTMKVNSLLLSSSGRALLSSQFGTCTPITADWKSFGTFSQAIMDPWAGTVQYNRRRGHHIGIKNITDVCGMLDSTRPYNGLIDVVQAFQESSQCLDIEYSSVVASISDIDDFSGGRSWTYQTCAEFGYYQTADGLNQPFKLPVPLRYSLQLCEDVFGISHVRINETNRYYGSDKPVGASKIFYINCEWDEWQTLSITKSLSAELPALLIADGAHCCNMDPYEPGVMSPSIQAAQKTIQQQIQKWL